MQCLAKAKPLRAYYEQHRETLDAMKRAAIASVPCQTSFNRMYYDCPCGAKQLGCKNLQFHFCSLRHRAYEDLGDSSDK